MATEHAPVDPGPEPERDVGAEFDGLVHALGAHVRRARSLGRRLPTGRRARTPEPTPRPSSASGPGAVPPSPIPKPIPELTPGRAPGRASEPAPPTRPAVAPAAVSASAGAGPAAGAATLGLPARSAEDVRVQAAAAPDLASLRVAVARCEACDLCRTRTQTVFQDGQGARRVLFVGEAPGADEDRTGVPFVGRAGQLLTDIITRGMGIPRQDVWIANVLKCRPPDNREPTRAEKLTCTPWLDRQIQLMDPVVLIPLGRHAAMHVLGIEAPMGAMRKRIHTVGGRAVVPTFHPAYLLRSPGEKKECWADIQLAMGLLGLERPPAARAPEPGA